MRMTIRTIFVLKLFYRQQIPQCDDEQNKPINVTTYDTAGCYYGIDLLVNFNI